MQTKAIGNLQAEGSHAQGSLVIWVPVGASSCPELCLAEPEPVPNQQLPGHREPTWLGQAHSFLIDLELIG